METRVQSLLISLAIIVLSFTFLAPRIVYPTPPVVLLSQTVALTRDNYEMQYNLALNDSDQLNIQLSGNGELVNLRITQPSSPSQPLVDQEEQTIFSFTWTVPQTGLYVFTVSADAGDAGATATIMVTKQ
jgi:type 1 fimbria pilin